MFAFFNQTPVQGGGGDPQTAPAIAVPTAEQTRELVTALSERLGETYPKDHPVALLHSSGPPAFDSLARTEGILAALESSHAVFRAMELAKERAPDDVIVVCLSGRGDKDAAEIARLKGSHVQDR